MVQPKMVKMEKMGKNVLRITEIKGKVFKRFLSTQNCQVHGLKTRFGVPKSEGPPCDQAVGANGKTC